MNTRRMWYSAAFLLLAPAMAGLAADKDLYGDPLPEGAKSRLGTARLRIASYAPPLLSPDGKTLLVQSNAGLLRIDPATGATQGKVPGQLFGTPAVISADGKRAVHTTYEGVTVWDTASGKALVKVERRLPSTEFGVALSADGKTLALGGTGDRTKKEQVTVLVWDVAADKELKKIAVPLNEFANVALSADGKTLATWGSHYDPDAKMPDPETNPTKFVTFWDVGSGKELSKFRVGGYTPAGVAFAPSGAVAAVAGNNSTIDLVDAKTGASKHLLLGRSRMGRSIAFSPDGTTVFAAADDGAVQRWKVLDGSRLSTTEAPGGPALYNPRVRALSAESGVAWATRGAATVVWEVPSGKPVSPEGGHTGLIRGLAITPDVKHVITSSEDGTALKWEMATGKPLGAVTLHQPNSGLGGYASAAVFSPDATRALVRDVGGGLGVHDVATGTQQYVIPAPYEGASYGAFSPDGSKVVVASSSYDPKKTPARVSVWDVAAARRVAAIELPGFASVSAAVTPDGKHLVTAARKPAEKGNGEFVIAAWDAATGAKKGEATEEAGYTTPQVACAADNKTAAVVTAKGQLVSFDIASGKVAKTLDINRRVPAVAPVFSPDGKKLAVAGQMEFGPTPTAPVLVLDWESGATKHTFAAPGGTPAVMAFSPDGNWLVTGSPDTTATVWDVRK